MYHWRNDAHIWKDKADYSVRMRFIAAVCNARFKQLVNASGEEWTLIP